MSNVFKGEGVFVGGISINTDMVKRFVNTRVTYEMVDRNCMCIKNAANGAILFTTSSVTRVEWLPSFVAGQQCLSITTYSGSNYKIMVPTNKNL